MNKYRKGDLIVVAKRKNNLQRKFLIVNKLQAKHLAVSPDKTLELFHTLGSILKEKYLDEKVLIIGFAETATAIGAVVAGCFSKTTKYIHTTRENIQQISTGEVAEQIIDFSEEHSHATEQKLFCSKKEEFIGDADRIIFVEDEVTTGNTILNFIKAFRAGHTQNIKFSIASILNAMSADNIKYFEESKIECHYILKIDIDDFDTEFEYEFEQNEYNPDEMSCITMLDNNNHQMKHYDFGGMLNPRSGVVIGEYESACRQLSDDIIYNLGSKIFKSKDILILGTEEFMYPAIHIAETILKKYNPKSVKTHSTTRSPILVSASQDYPINSRYNLKSLYDEERSTFIYNLDIYDKVLIVTDSINCSNTDRKSTRLNSIH